MTTQEAKEEAMHLAMQYGWALFRRGMEIHVLQKSGRTHHLVTAREEELWQSARLLLETMPSPRVRILIPYEDGYLFEFMNKEKWPERLGKIRLPGGGVEAHEEPLQAIMRELYEEFNVPYRISAQNILYEYDARTPSGGYEHIFRAKYALGLDPGMYSAEDGEINVLVKDQLTNPRYIGPEISM